MNNDFQISRHYSIPRLPGKAKFLLSVLLVAMTGPVSAQTWTGAGDDDFWFNTLNWSTNSIPNSAGANAIVGTPSPTIVNGNVVVNTLTVNAGGIVTINPGFFIALGTSATPLTNNGTINLLNGSSMGLHNSVVNTGLIHVQAGATATTLGNIVGTSTLSGGGTIRLSGANARIFDQNAGTPTLTIANQTIEGEGSIGLDSFFMNNQALGLIHANSAGNTLTVNPAGFSNVINATNQGTMQASNGGILALENGGWDNTGGTIQALNGSEVRLSAALGITGGTLSTSGSGIIRVVDGDFNNFLNGLNLNGNLELTDGSALRLLGTIDNTGNIDVNSSATATTLRATGNVTLSGGGTITLTGANARFIDDQPGQPTVTVANQRIQGQGLLGGDFFVVNQANGLINANSSGNVLNLAPSIFGVSQNQGIMQASSGGILAITGGGDFNNAGGTIQALNGSEVRLSGGLGITGGTLSTAGSGVIRVINNDFNNVLDSVTLNGNLEITDGSALRLLNGINNTGNIRVNSGANTTVMRWSNNGTLTGGGTITLAGTDARFIDDQPGTPTLTVANQTIEGRGFVGGFNILNQANGTFHANSTGNTLTISPDGFSNAGTLRATNGGTLVVNANSSEGALIDVGAGSLVDINGGASATLIRGGGTLRTDGGLVGMTFAPGDSVGTLSLVTENLGAGIGVGNLDIELASASSYDLLTLSMNSGASSINGLLSVDLLGGYIPSNTDVFTVLSGLSAVPGFQQFSNAPHGSTLLTVGGEGTFTVSYVNGQVRLSNFTVPEPATGLLLLAGAMAVGLTRRRN